MNEGINAHITGILASKCSRDETIYPVIPMSCLLENSKAEEYYTHGEPRTLELDG